MKNPGAVETLIPGQLMVCTYGGFAPVCYKDPTGQLIGHDVAFLTQFSKSLGLTVVTIEQSFDGIWTLPGQDVCDVTGAGIMKRDDRPVRAGGSWSDAYFEVKRSLLVRAADKTAFDDYETLQGKKIVVTRGSTADLDTQDRYRHCTIQYVDEIAQGHPDPQEYVVKTLIASHQADAFGEGDVSNQYLCDTYNKDVNVGLALADVHRINDGPETFNFITRNAGTGLLERLNAFIVEHKGRYLSMAN